METANMSEGEQELRAYLAQSLNLETRDSAMDSDVKGGFAVLPTAMANEWIKEKDKYTFVRKYARKFVCRNAHEFRAPSLGTEAQSATWGNQELGTGTADDTMRIEARNFSPKPLNHKILVSKKLVRASEMGVIDFIIDISQTSQLVQCIMGNHESLFLDFLNGADIRPFLINGGGKTLQSYRTITFAEKSQWIPAEHISFLKSLTLWIELEEYYLVHAGFKPGVDVRNQNFQDMIWIRDPFLFSEYDFGKKVIFGHTPFTEPFIMDNKIGLDTGAVYGNKLTCLELPSMRFYSVEA